MKTNEPSIEPSAASQDQPSEFAPQSPPKDRDSLDSILMELEAYKIPLDNVSVKDFYSYWPELRKVKAAIRHLSTKEMLDKLPEKRTVDWQDISTPELIAKQSEAYGWNQVIDEIRAALTREENHDDSK